MDLVERLGDCISKDDMDTIIEACDEIERLRAEVASLTDKVIVLEGALGHAERDANRYRWLRDEGDRTWSPMKNRFPEGAKGCDAAIDFAIAALGKEER